MAARPCTSPWTTELEDIAVVRWKAGASANAIAGEFGEPFTRQSVYKLIVRRGEVARETPERLVVRGRQRPPPKPKKPKPAPPVYRLAALPAQERALPEPSGPVSFDDLRSHHCRWPIGEVNSPDFGFCGKRRIEGKSYCPHHDKRAHQPLKPHEPKTGNELARSLRRWAA